MTMHAANKAWIKDYCKDRARAAQGRIPLGVLYA